jgi:hypothetical protein
MKKEAGVTTGLLLCASDYELLIDACGLMIGLLTGMPTAENANQQSVRRNAPRVWAQNPLCSASNLRGGFRSRR